MGRLRIKIGVGLALLLGSVAAASLALLPEAGLPAAAGPRGVQWILWGALTVGFGAGFWLWMNRSVLLPLERTAQAVREMAAGRLDASVPRGAPDEIGELGRRVNEMSANVQETLLHVWQGTGECQRLIENARRELSGSPQEEVAAALSNIDRGRKTIEALRSFVAAFEFYEIRIDPDEDRLISGRQAPDAKN
jgi:HAMP domain-containing protein